MSAENDGGPAFPFYRSWEDRKGYTVTDSSDGMSLRDYFAAKAMQGYIASGQSVPDYVAEWAYQNADAMLKARLKVQP